MCGMLREVGPERPPKRPGSPPQRSPGSKKAKSGLYTRKFPTWSAKTLNFVYTAAAGITGTVADFEPPQVFGLMDPPQWTDGESVPTSLEKGLQHQKHAHQARIRRQQH